MSTVGQVYGHFDSFSDLLAVHFKQLSLENWKTVLQKFLYSEQGQLILFHNWTWEALKIHIVSVCHLDILAKFLQRNQNQIQLV